MNDSDEEDTFLEEILDGAMAPYAGRLPPEQLSMLRRVMREELREDGTAQRLLSAARPRVAPKQSGEVPTEASTAASGPAVPAPMVPLRRRSGG